MTDRLFALFCLALIFSPVIGAIITHNWWWLLGYFPIFLIFGL